VKEMKEDLFTWYPCYISIDWKRFKETSYI